jgi:hypothetical protein
MLDGAGGPRLLSGVAGPLSSMRRERALGLRQAMARTTPLQTAQMTPCGQGLASRPQRPQVACMGQATGSFSQRGTRATRRYLRIAGRRGIGPSAPAFTQAAHLAWYRADAAFRSM